MRMLHYWYMHVHKLPTLTPRLIQPTITGLDLALAAELLFLLLLDLSVDLRSPGRLITVRASRRKGVGDRLAGRFCVLLGLDGLSVLRAVGETVRVSTSGISVLDT
jgi:hypothetical protein